MRIFPWSCCCMHVLIIPVGFFLNTDYFNQISFFFSSCRLTLNHPRSLSPAVSVLTAHQDKTLHAGQTPLHDGQNIDQQMGTNAV